MEQDDDRLQKSSGFYIGQPDCSDCVDDAGAETAGLASGPVVMVTESRTVDSTVSPGCAETMDDGNRRLDNAQWISLDRIAPDPGQPRRKISGKKLEELAESIRVRGVLQPIRVRRCDDGYVIVAGERRYRACRIAGLAEIPAIVCEQDEFEARIDSIVENLHRVDLNAMERADALVELRQTLGSLPWETIALRVGLSRRHIMNLIGLYALPENIQAEIRDGTLTEKHGRALRMLLNEEGEMQKLYRKITTAQISGDDSLELARVMLGRRTKKIELDLIRKSSTKFMRVLSVTDPEKWSDNELLELRQIICNLSEEVERTIRRNSHDLY